MTGDRMDQAPAQPVTAAVDAQGAAAQHRGMSESATGLEARLRALIRDVPDFPAPGILFRDITPLLYDAPALRAANDALAGAARAHGIDVVAGIEARGFIFGVPVAERLAVPFVPVRKPGKLPASYESVAYALEYGESTLQVHRDPSIAGRRVLVVDDLLATGGTAEAAGRLVRALGGEVGAYAFCIELAGLGGASRLGDAPMITLVRF
jgi:adenine phosphoribosyltransferase